MKNFSWSRKHLTEEAPGGGQEEDVRMFGVALCLAKGPGAAA